MKVRLIKKKSIENFVVANAQGRISFRIWLALIKRANWSVPADIAGTFGSSDLLGKGSNRVVFDIGGNHYRLICSYHFGVKMVHIFVKWIGTHAEYTQLCKSNKQFSINLY